MNRFILLTYAGLGLVAACGSRRPEPETPSTDVSVARSGETTVVSIQDHDVEPENLSCKAYCDRLTACWYAMPNVDPMLTSKDVFAKCWSEQHQCKTPTTEVHCCGSVTACGDFVKCENTARDVVTDCRRRAAGTEPPAPVLDEMRLYRAGKGASLASKAREESHTRFTGTGW